MAEAVNFLYPLDEALSWDLVSSVSARPQYLLEN